jgi:hypothetical protein
MAAPVPDPVNLFFWKVIAILGATLGVVGWLRFLGVGGI